MFNPRQMNTCKYPFPPTQKKGKKKQHPPPSPTSISPRKKTGASKKVRAMAQAVARSQALRAML